MISQFYFLFLITLLSFSIVFCVEENYCALYKDCYNCTRGNTEFGCGWCESNNACFPADSSEGPSWPFLCSTNSYQFFDFGEGSCASSEFECSNYKNCSTCIQYSPICGWSDTNKACLKVCEGSQCAVCNTENKDDVAAWV